jgi:drug/metabolite transporter (DMT)-like permease
VQTEFAIAAAVGCALCNGIAAVVQKVSVDKAKAIRHLELAVLVKLAGQLPYAIGVALDFLAGLLTLVAVHSLPLFTVQTIIASSVVITAFIERVFMHQVLPRQIYWATACMLVGLGLLAVATHSEGVAVISSRLTLAIELFPIVLLILAAILLKWRSGLSTALLAIASGIGFGGVSVVGRVITYPHPVWLVIFQPLMWALIVYGVLGLFLFTAALQRTLATSANGLMVAAQTVVPLFVGIFLLGDTARDNLWILLYLGGFAILVGSVVISQASSKMLAQNV